MTTQMLSLSFCIMSLAALVQGHHPQRLHGRQAPSVNDTRIAAAWYAGWHATDFPLSDVSWEKYTHMTYAFAITTPDPSKLGLDASDETRLIQFVSSAHKHGVKASLSIGGWTGSRYFTTAVGSAKNRTAFVGAVTNIVRRYKLDGVDFDWEYPGKQGLGCNLVGPDDTANFLLFLQELRNTATGRSIILTAATYVEPFVDASGQPSSDVSGFADVLDYIAIMNYDLKSNTAIGAGPSSPLDDYCAPSGAKYGSASSSVEAWSKAGIPPNKLVLGVGAYGHSRIISPSVALSKDNSSLNAYPAYNPSNVKIGDRWDGEGGVDACGVMQGPGGVYTYWGLIEEGFLKPDGSAEEGIVFRYDDCSETPFAYSPSKQVFISYEDPRSFAAKGDFIYTMGLAGFAIWEAGGDYKDALLDSIKNASATGNAGVRTQKAAATTPQSTGSRTPDSGSMPSLHLSPRLLLLGSMFSFGWALFGVVI